MTSAALALQAAIVAALLADDDLAALVGDRIHDAPPRDAAFPYVSLGLMRATDWSTATEDGAEHEVTVHVWSRERGKRACHAIMAAIRGVLHDAPLTLDGHALVNLRCVDGEVRREADGITWRGALNFRAVTEPA